MKRFNLIKPVYAHCDLPCGIYETDTARHAADTCLRMIEKIEELGADTTHTGEAHNQFVRAVGIKEKHADLVKQQIYTLWSDFFKPEHIEKLPELHETMWKTAKQCSKVKQTASREECEKLISLVHEVVHMFEVAQAK